MARPFFNKSIEELEALFRESGNSHEQLRLLVAELSHRGRPRAVALKRKVEDALAAGSDFASGANQGSLGFQPTPPLEKETHQDREHNQTSAAHFQDFVVPEDFTLIQPLGTRPRPGTYRPELKRDLRLPISSADQPVKIFRVALAELISEMKRRRVGFQQFVLEDGKQIQMETGGFSYQFDFYEEANIFEGARIEILIGGHVVEGNITGVLQGQIIITLQENFGP